MSTRPTTASPRRAWLPACPGPIKTEFETDYIDWRFTDADRND